MFFFYLLVSLLFGCARSRDGKLGGSGYGVFVYCLCLRFALCWIAFFFFFLIMGCVLKWYFLG